MKQFARAVLWSALGSSVIAPLALAARLSRTDGDRMERKLEEIRKTGSADAPAAKKTPVSENELNSYLAFNANDKIPRGLRQPRVAIGEEGRLAGRVLVDIDEFKRGRGPRGPIDPLSYLSGEVPVTARGVLRSGEGKGRFHLESAEIVGVPVPRALAQELVAYFSRTRQRPAGFDIDAPFDLPVRIRRIETGRGAATVVQ